MGNEGERERAVVSRRAVLHTAWTVPVITAAVAAPASASSLGTPALTLSVFALDDNYAWGTVTFARDGQVDLTQAFDVEGAPPSSWEAIYTGQATNSSGYYASTLPRVVIGNYAQIRVTAFVEGFGLVVSNSVTLTDVWAPT